MPQGSVQWSRGETISHTPPSSHYNWDLLPSSLLWWDSMRLPLVGWSLVPGGTPSSSACIRCARVLIQDRTISSTRNRSTSNTFIEKGFKPSKDSSYPVFKAGVPKRWLLNTTHRRGTFKFFSAAVLHDKPSVITWCIWHRLDLHRHR